MMLDAFLTNCRLADGRVVDIGIADGKIAIVGEGAAPTSSNSARALDIGGDLLLPGLGDGHMHLDKTLTGLPWMGHAAHDPHRNRYHDPAVSAAVDRRTRRQSDPRMRRARHQP